MTSSQYRKRQALNNVLENVCYGLLAICGTIFILGCAYVASLPVIH